MLTKPVQWNDFSWARRRLAVLVAVAAMYVALLIQRDLLEPEASDGLIFYRLFAFGGPVVVVMFTLFVMVAFLPARHADRTAVPAADEYAAGLDVSRAAIALLMIAVFGVSGAIAHFVMLDYPFSMDEFGAIFQARLIASGRWTASLPQSWSAYIDGITPGFVLAREGGAEWVSMYLPLNAIIRAPFERMSIGWASTAMLASLCVLWLAGIARTLWPGERERQYVTLFAFASSTQFLLTAATPYAMTAHLAFNIAWLRLWVAGGRATYAAGLVGALAVLLHQPVPHPLFAAPFLLRALRERRWMLLAWMSVCYSTALGASVWWQEVNGFGNAGGAAAFFAVPRLLSVFTLTLNVESLLTWQTPVVGLLLLISLRHYPTLRAIERDALVGVLIPFAFFLFFRPVHQGHGWGWRYGHQTLGNIALLAGAMWPALCAAATRPRALRLAVVSLGLTMAVQLPMQAYMAYHFTAPFAAAAQWLRARDADIVVVPSDSMWYGDDLIRNDPSLARPVIMRASSFDRLPASDRTQAPGRVQRVTTDELEQLGLERVRQR